jgi:hypothetical protein
MLTYLTALSKTLHALADGLMLVFQHPADMDRFPFVASLFVADVLEKNALALIQSVSE